MKGAYTHTHAHTEFFFVVIEIWFFSGRFYCWLIWNVRRHSGRVSGNGVDWKVERKTACRTVHVDEAPRRCRATRDSWGSCGDWHERKLIPMILRPIVMKGMWTSRDGRLTLTPANRCKALQRGRHFQWFGTPLTTAKRACRVCPFHSAWISSWILMKEASWLAKGRLTLIPRAPFWFKSFLFLLTRILSY